MPTCHSPRFGLAWLASASLALALAGCQGELNDGPSGPDGPRVNPVCESDAIVLGTAPMRRLANVEYGRTLRDLFPGVSLESPSLPPDTTASGFENDAPSLGASDVSVARWEETAFRHGTAVTATPAALSAFLPCAATVVDAASETACGEQLVRDFGRRAFRRPLEPAEIARFTTFFEAQRTDIDFTAAVQLTVTAMLESPSFLYRLEIPGEGSVDGAAIVPLDPHQMASRLSYFLWQSMPDETLFAAADANELASVEQLEAQARRMLDDPRARPALVDFHRQWLELDRILEDEHAARLPDLYPTWTPALRSAVHEEQDRFIASTLLDHEGTLAALLTSRQTWVNGPLAGLYGVDGPSDEATWAEVTLPEGERAGLLTRAGFLASHAHSGNGSPPLRGIFVMEHLLCEPRPSPPGDADLSPPMTMPGEGPRTNRQLFEERTSPERCQGCHVRIDGFGFGLENYDAIGAFRTIEHGLPVDASGNLSGTGVDGPYVGGVELSEALSESRRVEACAARQWVRYAIGRGIEETDVCMLSRLSARFTRSGGDVRDLLVGVVTSPEFQNRPSIEGAP